MEVEAVTLAGLINGVAARFIPEAMRGHLIEAEHLGRYWWASPLAANRRVLDAGCGTGYGSALLAAAGAAEVIGVDPSESLLEAAAAGAPEGVRFERAELRRLPFADGHFGLAVCCDALEHADDADAVIDELKRVVDPSGLLVIAFPHRGTAPRDAQERAVMGELRERFAHVSFARQHTAVASTILTDDGAAAPVGEAMGRVSVHKVVEGQPGRETCVLAVASDEPLPALASEVTLTHLVELARWLEHEASQRSLLDDQAEQLRRNETALAERSRLLTELAESERQLAELPELRQRLKEAERDRDEALIHLTHFDAIKSSFSWRVTKPLRTLKLLVRRLGGD
jgi:SAM-dependent methyltransferase